jgi:hypothetical protein
MDDLLFPYTIDLSIYNHISNRELAEHIDRVGVVFYIRGEKIRIKDNMDQHRE